MRKGLLGSIVVLATSAGLAFGQMPRSAVDPNAPIGQMIQAQAQLPPPVNGQLTAPAQVLTDPMHGDGDCEPYIERFWLFGEYLLWAYKPGPNPIPLITTGPITAGNIFPGSPAVITVFGGNNIDFGAVSGARFGWGGWFPGSDKLGIEASGLILSKQAVTGSVNTTGTLGLPAIGRPFQNANTGGTPSTFIVTGPNVTPGLAGDTGFATGTATSQLWTAEFNFIGNLYRGEFGYWNVMLGYRHVDLAESITILSSTTQGAAGSPPHFFESAVPLPQGDILRISDRFSTENRFNGGNIGTEVEFRYRRIMIDLANNVALGAMDSSINVVGVTTATTAAGANLAGSPANGGLLAGTTNIGRRQVVNFAVVEQPSVQIGYQFTRSLRVTVGYDFLYTYNVARPGLQIDPGINPNLTPSSPTFGVPGGTARPAQLFTLTDYYAQGVNWGLWLRY
ncbi:MAG TPA: BBP7 family outer membrane beta-barrel protein [Gemmataceae bacterium]|nr:BBP7 family outer membrane beta-barrel protein [Gemmataceae bacterium]